MRPMAGRTPTAEEAPVHVSRSFPSLPRTRETELLLELATQRSAPSDLTRAGRLPTVVRPSATLTCAVEVCREENLSSVARRLTRFNAPSTVSERNFAI